MGTRVRVYPSKAIIDAKGDRLMAAWEVLEEVDWQLQAGTHPLLIAQILHRTPGSLEKIARRYDRPDLATVFSHTYPLD